LVLLLLLLLVQGVHTTVKQDKGQRTKDKGQRTNDKGQRTKNKGQMTKDLHAETPQPRKRRTKPNPQQRTN
jgi:hypothetical protein